MLVGYYYTSIRDGRVRLEFKRIQNVRVPPNHSGVPYADRGARPASAALQSIAVSYVERLLPARGEPESQL